jgi:hypothetical protein
MAILNKGQTFSDGEQVTSAKLNTAVDGATFASGAVDDVSTQLSGGAIIVKDGGVTTAKIADSNVTKGKIENVANMKVLGNTSGAPAAPQEVSILDEDDMTSDSNTSIPTQQSVKAYVGSLIGTADRSSDSGLVTIGDQGSLTLGGGLIIKFGSVNVNSPTVAVTFRDSSGNASPFPNGIYGVNATVNDDVSTSSETCSVNSPTVDGCDITGYRGIGGAAVGRCFFVAYGF